MSAKPANCDYRGYEILVALHTAALATDRYGAAWSIRPRAGLEDGTLEPVLDGEVFADSVQDAIHAATQQARQSIDIIEGPLA